jgi:hypothetical protein
MKILLAFLVFAITALAVPPVMAADVTVSWAAPSANTDGSTPAKLGGYNLYSAPTDAALSALPNSIAGGRPLSVGNVLTYTYRNVIPGTYVYAVTAWYCPASGACTESAQSAHVSTTVSPAVPQPGPPVSVKITVTVSSP